MQQVLSKIRGINDPYILGVLKALVIVIFVALLFPSILALTMIVATKMFQGQNPSFVNTSVLPLIDAMRNFPKSSFVTLFAALPGFVIVLSLDRTNQGRYTRFGRTVFTLLVLGVLVAGSCGSVLDASSYQQARFFHTGLEFAGGKWQAPRLEATVTLVQDTLRTFLTYFFILLGIDMNARGTRDDRTQADAP
jgi:hypothetical protein